MGGLYHELRRRNVFRVAGVYAVVGWLLAQAAVVLETSLGFPAWFDGVVVGFLLLGFPIAMIFAWAFEMTPEGMKLTVAVPEGESIAPKTGRILDYVILGGLMLVGVMIVADRMMPEAVVTAPPQSSFGEDAVSAASIAVLPFADLSPGGDQEYFSDGISEEILNVLARVEGIKVASRTSSFQFKGQEAIGIPFIAGELGVRHVLEGSVRKAGDTIRITAQLIDAETDEHLWSDNFNRTLTTEDIFAIQDEIANAIVGQLRDSMGIGDDEVLPVVETVADTQNVNAYALFLEANARFTERGTENIRESIRIFEQVTVLDPKFARAWAGLAAAYVVAPGWNLPRSNYSLVTPAAEKAITLNPELSMPYAALGLLNQIGEDRDWEVVIEMANRAVENDPKNATAHNWRGIALVHLGLFEAADADFAVCTALDANYVNCRRWLGFSYLLQNRLDASRAQFNDTIKAGSDEWSAGIVSYLYLEEEQHTALLYFIRGWTEFKFGKNASWAIAPIYAALTDPNFDHAEGLRLFEIRLNNQFKDDQSVDLTDRLFINSYNIFFNNYDDLKYYIAPYHWHPLLNTPKNEIHRRRLINEAKLPAYWREHGFPPQCRPIGDDDFECD